MSELRPILLAEDSDNDIELILGALEENNLANRVVVVRNGEEALDYLYGRGSYTANSSPPPVVVLLDIKMPKVSGIETLRLMKSDPALRNIPAVMLTSSREGPDMKECYRLGANAYVVKPLVFQDFFEAIKVIGNFWGVINELPQAINPKPGTLEKEGSVREP
jgi:CheY-like chemotaxis protein